jgi:allantoinase
MSESNPRIPFKLAGSRSTYAPPAAGRLIVHVVVNIECWRYDQPMPRSLLSPPQGRQTVPDVPNFAWAEYGLRCGMPRLFDALHNRGISAGCAMNAQVIDTYPNIAEGVLERGWEIIGHGLHQRALPTEDNEREVIRHALDILRRQSGQTVRGWLGPGLAESQHSPDLLREQGIEYLCDWVLDDLPCWMRTRHGPMIAMPYTLELNDSVLFAVQHHRGEEFLQRGLDTLERFERELPNEVRVLTLALHPHLIAVPHRIGYLERLLDRLQAHPEAVFMTGQQIADWFRSVSADEHLEMETALE